MDWEGKVGNYGGKSKGQEGGRKCWSRTHTSNQWGGRPVSQVQRVNDGKKARESGGTEKPKRGSGGKGGTQNGGFGCKAEWGKLLETETKAGGQAGKTERRLGRERAKGFGKRSTKRRRCLGEKT